MEMVMEPLGLPDVDQPLFRLPVQGNGSMYKIPTLQSLLFGYFFLCRSEMKKGLPVCQLEYSEIMNNFGEVFWRG